MTEHTPGPWFVATGHSPRAAICVMRGIPTQSAEDDSVPRFVYVRSTQGWPWVETREDFEAMQAANARLIAAAPDLLAALKALVADVTGTKLVPILKPQTFCYELPALPAALAAIAKAEGKEP